LGSKKITTRSEAVAALGRPSAIRELRLVAEQWAENAAAPPPALNLVAGSGIKLDGPLSCSNPACRRELVDVLFRHAWHYFDTILLPDGVGRLVLSPPEGLKPDDLQSKILGMVEVALHLESLGASRLVQYYPTTHGAYGHAACSPLHRPTRWEAAWEGVESSILSEAEFRIKKLNERKFSIQVDHPHLEITYELVTRLDKDGRQTEEFLRAVAAHELGTQCMDALEEDLKVAQLLKGPLASTLWSHGRALSAISDAPDAASVAFHV